MIEQYTALFIEGNYCNMPLATLSSMNVVKLQGVFGDQVLNVLKRRGYKMGKTIGEGSYCKVKVAYKDHENGHLKIACKTINKRRASKEFVNKFLPREISIIKTVRHPHIVTILDILDTDDQVFIFMDICEEGDLLDYIRNRGPLPESKARRLFKQLVSAIDYLHSLDISHRDLKCENILLATEDYAKIADFGFSRWCRAEDGRRILSETFCGSAAYAAPEILQGIPYNPKMYDVWSLGCILFIMLTATMPFDDSNIKQMLERQTSKKLTFPCQADSSISLPAKKLVMHLLEPDVTKRSTIGQVKRNAWLREAEYPDLHAKNSRPATSKR
ncbi:testis-specific serine/threonine-protein kinase 6-like [Periplaneta americana]|uniref:testis-specific serine/threonine-protein kinase 6-like n=1 Tax=Periplaneta americana TaxID=6978 RepID=UPI0037E82C0D